MDWQALWDWLSKNLTGGIIGGFIGAFLGGFARFFWDLWLPEFLTWRRQQAVTRSQVLATYRDPILLAAYDFQSRLYNVIRKGGLRYMQQVEQEQYAIDSTLYVAAQYFAWAEILRQRIRLLNYPELSQALDLVSESVADTESGLRIFRLQQREIGERMLVLDGKGGEQRVLNYTEFLDQLHDEPSSPLSRSLEPLRRAINGVEANRAMLDRLKPIQHALVKLIKRIDDARHPWLDQKKIGEA